MKKIIATFAIILAASSCQATQLFNLAARDTASGNVAQGDDIILQKAYDKGTYVKFFVQGKCDSGSNLNVVVMDENMVKVKTAIGFGCNLAIDFHTKKTGKYFVALSAQYQRVIPFQISFIDTPPGYDPTKPEKRMETGSMEGDEPEVSQNVPGKATILVTHSISQNTNEGMDMRTVQDCNISVAGFTVANNTPLWMAQDPQRLLAARDRDKTYSCMTKSQYEALPNHEPLK